MALHSQGPSPALLSDSRFTAPFSGLTPASLTIPASDATNSPPASQAETSAKPQAPPAPGPTLKPSVLFGMLSSPPANPSALAAPAVSSARPMFKPIFVAPPKSGKEGPVPCSHSQVTTEASSSSAHTPATSSLPSLSVLFLAAQGYLHLCPCQLLPPSVRQLLQALARIPLCSLARPVSVSPQQRLGGPPPAQPQTLPGSLSLALV